MTDNKTKPKEQTITITIQQQQQQQQNDEPLEKAKPIRLPGINASLVFVYGIFGFMFAIGWINLNNCSITRLIPIYLIVSGILGVGAKFLNNSTHKWIHYLSMALIFLYCIWQILGTYWVYPVYQPNYDWKIGKYCNRITYLLAFWILTLQYTVVTFTVLLSACYWLMKGDFQKK